MVLLSNDPEGLDALLDSLNDVQLANAERWEKMRKQGGRDLRKSVAYREAGDLLQKTNPPLAKLASPLDRGATEGPPNTA